MRRTLALAPLVAAALALLPGAAAATQISISVDSDSISVHGDRVVIRPGGVPEAEISAGGTLRIDGKGVAVPERDRVLLERYNRRVRRLEDTAVDMGIQGAELGVTAVAATVVAVLTGDHDHVEKAVRPDAEELKEKARKLCHDVEDLRQLQAQLAVEVPQFRPYAVMNTDHDCRVSD